MYLISVTTALATKLSNMEQHEHKTPNLKYLAKYYGSIVLICVCYSKNPPDRKVSKEQGNTVPGLFAYSR